MTQGRASAGDGMNLGMGVRFDDVPDDVPSALGDEVFQTWERPRFDRLCREPAVGRGAIPVSGSLPEVTGRLAGRGTAGTAL
jgi:hypothetical protein